MKKSTKLAMGIGTGVAFITASILTALCGKKTGEDENTNLIETEGTEVEDSEESTDEVEN